MSITFESAVATLKSMFPEWDEETLSTILMSNNYHVEQTIETVLSMGDTSGVESPPAVSTSPTQQRPYAAPQPAPAPAPRQQSPPAERPSQPVPSSSAGKYRGSRCDLPDDFLRPPNWQSKNSATILADEELALMLQNELFQSEARRVLGDNFMRENYGDDTAASGVAPSAAGGAPRRGPSRVQPAGSNAPPEPNPDLGIMRALSSMGSAAKRNLTQLAQGFNSSSSTNNSSNTARTGNNANSGGNISRGGFGGGSPPGSQPGATQNRRRGSGGGSKKKGAFNDLDDDDEEGTEIITFSSQGGSRSQHMLQGGGSSGAPPASADGDDDEADSANPLLASRSNQVI